MENNQPVDGTTQPNPQPTTPNPTPQDGTTTQTPSEVGTTQPNPDPGTGQQPNQTPLRNETVAPQQTPEVPEGYTPTAKFTASQQESLRLGSIVENAGIDLSLIHISEPTRPY